MTPTAVERSAVQELEAREQWLAPEDAAALAARGPVRAADYAPARVAETIRALAVELGEERAAAKAAVGG